MPSVSQKPAAAPGTLESVRIAGFQRAGMLDWPGKVTATVFLAGCGLACPYCHNPELVHTPRRTEDPSALLAHVRDRRAWLDGVVVTGGEPCIRRTELMTLLGALKAEGMPVKLDTNGTHPDVLGEVIEAGFVDFVALDVKATPERYALATGRHDVWSSVSRAIRTVIDSGVDHEFRTTCYPLAVGPGDPEGIARQLIGGRRYVLQQFRAMRTLDPGAASVRPHDADTLSAAALRCSAYLPTVVRGA